MGLAGLIWAISVLFAIFTTFFVSVIAGLASFLVAALVPWIVGSLGLKPYPAVALGGVLSLVTTYVVSFQFIHLY
ncbi:hypothetical protein EH165_06545 [Nakamurella antarctica]|uniref:Uncharacterized protein n=1 Tax=Nakamurella antarctica TaxID=1902245 RepID=A0A3G8ZW30_9ACTN|nr:hypothetical protein EH165_06545 [Nakamurella antarctica]